MHFYRRWQPVAAISFDLDDTLYDNGPAIERAEQWMLEHLRSEYLATAMLDKPRWLDLKRTMLIAHPELRQDVSLARQRTIHEAMLQGGMAAAIASREAEQVFAGFLAERSKIEVSDATHELLARLAERYPLVVITNGNVLVERLGLDGHFQHILKAGGGFRMKPAPDLFQSMAERLGLPPHQILHVGDDVTTDVAGAVGNGYRSAWLNDVGQEWRSLRILPDVMLTRLEQLLTLL